MDEEMSMNKLVMGLLGVLIVMVAAHGFLVWRVGENSRADAQRQRCIQRVEATAMVGLLAPASKVDPAGRLRAIKTLGTHLDGC
jgi:uncharacterized iron-regulated membrane protein